MLFRSRTGQYRASFDPVFCLRFARGLVASKLRNGRTLLRRNWRGESSGDKASGEGPSALDVVIGSLQRSARAAAMRVSSTVSSRSESMKPSRKLSDRSSCWP